MICAVCTGKHHALECPTIHDTLIAIGVPPAPIAKPAPPEKIELLTRPHFAVRGRKGVIRNVMEATYRDLQPTG